MNPFRVNKPVRFAHCDPAGIMFFPRYFELLNEVVEDWFAGPLDTPFADLHLRHGQGVPTVRCGAEFAHPSRLGDDLGFELEVSEIGRSSCGLQVHARCGSELRAGFLQVLVLVNLKTMKPVAWPQGLRTRIGAYRVESQA